MFLLGVGGGFIFIFNATGSRNQASSMKSWRANRYTTASNLYILIYSLYLSVITKLI